MYKINTHNITTTQHNNNNPDWRVVMTNYVCMCCNNENKLQLQFPLAKGTFNFMYTYMYVCMYVTLVS